MCTLVCHWQPDASTPAPFLALRDEFVDRAFDPPGRWWPDHPGVVGGRDRQAGGSWCVTDVATATSAVVLNRPQPRIAAQGAPSRGALPLAGVRFGERWAEHVDVTGMAGFNLVLLSGQSVVWWSFDGDDLSRQELVAGTHVFSPRGLVPGPVRDRFASPPPMLRAYLEPQTQASTGDVWGHWLTGLRDISAANASDGVIVRRDIGDRRYETVFGQFVAAQPGVLRVDYLDRPVDGVDRRWTTQVWRAATA
jgi:Transport and Golgi organisation 2